MQLLLRSHFGLKSFQLLQLLSAIVLCHIYLRKLRETAAETKEKHCMDVKLKCVTSAYNVSIGVWYDPAYVATNVCATDMKSCRKFTNQCEFERANCKGETWEITKTELCDSINTGSIGTCNCPLSIDCSNNTNICARHSLQCKSFKNQCELEIALCRGEHWTTTNSLFCCQLKQNEQGACKVAAAKPTCATIDYKTCRAFSNNCEMIHLNENIPRKWHELSDRHCRCLELGFTGLCDCKTRF